MTWLDHERTQGRSAYRFCPLAKSRHSAFVVAITRLIVLQLFGLFEGASGAFVLDAIEHRPTYKVPPVGGYPGNGAKPPVDLKHEGLTSDGFVYGIDTSNNISRRTSIGCFQASFEITTQISNGQTWDPNDCYQYCQQRYPNETSYDIIVAVHMERCACVLRDMTLFKGVAPELCTYYCKVYRNPLCGGFPDYWGVFKEYDFTSMTGQGAYDPWRYIFYSVVAVKEINIRGGLSIPQGIMPERYFLHAVSTTSGDALYQFQMPLAGLIYGMQYDILNSRLVGLWTEVTTGRIRNDVDWAYKLATIQINTAYLDLPRLSLILNKVNVKYNITREYLAFTGASGIVSNQKSDCFIITQAEVASLKKDFKEHVYFIRIPDGLIIYDDVVDFKILQMFTNEKYGDVTVVGPRAKAGGNDGAMIYVKLARVRRNTLENKTVIDWQYNPVNTEYVADDQETYDLHVYPGVAASEHLFNFSAIAHRRAPVKYRDKAAIVISTVNIRNKKMDDWCNSTTVSQCLGSIYNEIPYASLYNREPGIPLSLKAPGCVDARFTMEAGEIVVNFDRATLQGAITVSKNNDYVPTDIDYSTQQNGTFDCSNVFDSASVWILGPFPSTSCLWLTSSRLQISLPKLINISVGDTVRLLPNKIYAIPSNGEWSPASLCAFQIDYPLSVGPPVILLTGPTSLDECSSLNLRAAESFLTGGLPTYVWSLNPSVGLSKNPKDLTNNPNRVLDPTKKQLFINALKAATTANSDSLSIPSSYMEAATSYTITLSLTGRWKLTTNKTVTITKLNFPAPMVSVLGGATTVYKKRTDQIALQAVGVPSSCSDNSSQLGYRWVASSGNFNFEDFPDIVTNGATLVIPPFTLAPDVIGNAKYNVYNFTVECFVNTPQGDVPDRTAYATVSVAIFRSPIYVSFRTGSRMLTRGDVLVLDVRSSQDPDYPTPSGQTFKGTFTWQCLSPPPLRGACFGGPPSGELKKLDTCRQDIGTQIVDGGVSFYAPLFDDNTYCQYARGVLMFQTLNFSIGEYKFTSTATSYDGRQASQVAYITITEVRVPNIVLNILNPQSKYPVTQAVRITGTEEGQRSDQPRTYSWAVLKYVINPLYNPDLAQARLNDPDNPYTVDQYTFVEQPSLDTTDQTRFETNPINPTIVIKPNVLQPSTTYTFRLNVRLPTVTGYSDISLTTAGLAPRSGSLKVTPLNATMDTSRSFEAKGWYAEDLPLSYNFGYVDFIGGKSVYNFFSTAAVPTFQMVQPRLPLGESSTNFTLYLFVDVSTPYGATTRFTIGGQSLPPQNTTNAIQTGLSAAKNADASSVINALNYLISINASSPDIRNEVMDILDAQSANVPPTAGQLTSQANLISKLISGGADGDDVVDQLQAVIIKADAANVLNPDENGPGGSLPGLIFGAIGSLTPGAPAPAPSSGTAAAQSLVMNKYRTVNPAFTFSDHLRNDDHPSERLGSAVSRQVVNHEPPNPLNPYVISDCPSAFCDVPGLACSPKVADVNSFYICCDVRHPETLCNDPPCWFEGNACPEPPPPSTASNSGLASTRRLAAKSMRGQDPEESNWFQSFKGFNFPDRNLSESEASDYDRAGGYVGWHPDIYERRLQYAFVPSGQQSYSTRLVKLENDEKPMLAQARAMTRDVQVKSADSYIEDAVQEVSYSNMPPKIASKLEAKQDQEDAAVKAYDFQLSRNNSQRMTKLAVLRDLAARSIIRQLISNEKPKQYPSNAFLITLGKTTNLSSVHNAFSFPKAYQVPADSPDYPTANNPVTGFAFIYVEYFKNPYDWDISNPHSPANLIVTLVVMKASTLDLNISQVSAEPIVAFADRDVFSSAVCLQWDRFTPGTPGGAWSSSGIVNNEQGCLVTALGDFGIFMDGRPPSSTSLIDAALYFDRNVFQSTCIGCGDASNLFVVAVLGLTLFTSLLLVLLGYVVDESRRSKNLKDKNYSRYYMDGDGITTPQSVDDPIAYKLADSQIWIFLLGTLWNVVGRDHAVVGCIFYHETFTRPQRLQCLVAILTGLMAVNAAVHSTPGSVAEAQEFMISGVLSALLVFPVFCGLVMMFNLRPVQVKKRLIKRAYSTREIDKINEERQRRANQSSLLPPAGYVALPPPVPGMLQAQTNLLSLPAPLPLPPLPPGMVGTSAMLALPGMAGGFGGMTGRLPLPPPPKYPPPPKNGKVPSPAALMPPLSWPKVGQPPPAPFPALQDASSGGTFQLPMLGARATWQTADTGATPDALHLPGSLQMETEAPALPAPSYIEDTKHSMAPPDRLPGQMTPGQMTPGPGTPGSGRFFPPPPPGAPSLGGTPRSQGLPTPGAGVGSFDGGVSPALSHRSGSLRGSASSYRPGGTGAMVPLDPSGGGAMPLFIRGQPPPMMPSPFPAAPFGPGGLMVPPGQPPTGFGAVAVPAGAPGLPMVPPMPPPPPREDDVSFVRRIRLTYMDKVAHEHDKHDLLEDLEELGRETPGWVFDSMTIMPYLASSTWSLAAIFVVLQYGMKFQPFQEQLWIKGSLIGLGVILGLLDLVRIVMMTLVELRKFENRKKAKAGQFLPRRVKKEGEKDVQLAPPPRLWKQAVAAPPLPKGKSGPQPPPRPAFLPKEGALPPQPMLGGGRSMTGPMGNLPVAPPPPRLPSTFSGNSMQASGFNPGPPSPGPATPKSAFSTSLPGRMGPPGSMTPQPGTPHGPGARRGPPPKLQSAADMMMGGTPGGTPRGGTPRGPGQPPSPANSQHSLHSLAQSLNQQVKAGRHPTPPPPPTAQPGLSGQPVSSSSSAPPPAPSAPPPNYSRPPSRPNSAQSVGAKARGMGPPLPPGRG